MKKNIVVLLMLTVCLSVCSCTGFAQEIQRIETFATDIGEVIEFAQDPSATPEEVQEKAEELLHPSSTITVEEIVDKFMSTDKGADITVNVGESLQIQLGSISTPQLLGNDDNLGGNVYKITAQVNVGGVAFTVDLTLLSNDAGMGIYAVDIK